MDERNCEHNMLLVDRISHDFECHNCGKKFTKEEVKDIIGYEFA